MKEQPTVKLRNGVHIPSVGLGVFRTPPGVMTQQVVEKALQCGYRHIDTAFIYGNEADVAEGLRHSGVPRSEVFLTTKIWNDAQGYEETLQAFELSLQRMKLDFVDLLLLHWPVLGKRLQAWKALEKIYQEGRARAIGVSNFMVAHLEELKASCHEMPQVNQIEVSPFLQQREVTEFCHAHGVVIEAYSPLTKGFRLQHPLVTRIARETESSSAQVLLRWGLQHGWVVLPKSTQPVRMAENLAAVEKNLSVTHLAQLDELEEGLVTGWDPRKAP